MDSHSAGVFVEQIVGFEEPSQPAVETAAASDSPPQTALATDGTATNPAPSPVQRPELVACAQEPALASALASITAEFTAELTRRFNESKNGREQFVSTREAEREERFQRLLQDSAAEREAR